MTAPRRKVFIPALMTAMAALSADLAWADDQDPFNFTLGAAAHYEDNLFRLSDSTDTRAAIGKSQRSDRVLITNAGIKIDKPYSLQRFQLDANVLDSRYDTNSNLDYTAFNYRAAWLWQLTPNVSGILSADQQQILNNFSDFRGFNNQINNRRSVQTNESRLFKIDGLIGGGIHLLGGLSNIRSRNSTTFNAVGDYEQNGVEAGVKYVAPSENAITLMQRESRGNFQGRVADPVTQLDSGFDQHETEAILDWRLSGKSVINAHLGYIDRQYDHFSSRDYDGATGLLSYTWEPTGKLRIGASLSRRLYGFQQSVNSYYVDNTFSISPLWQVAARTSLRLRYDYSQRDYFGAIVPIAERRKDHVQLFLLAADWKATRTITISGMLQHEKRDSNFNDVNSINGDLNYDANSATINAQLLF